MSHRDHARELESAADRIADLPRPDLQIMLRRAAVRLRNAGSIPLDEDVEEALGSIAGEIGMTRNDLIRRIIREWLETNAYLPVHDVEDTESEGSA